MTSLSTPAALFSLESLRRHWARRQGLGATGLSAAAVVETTGWVRSLGGADPYLGLLARSAALTREAVDAAIAAGEIAVSPAARGCMYLVSRGDRALALAVAERQSRLRSERELQKLGVPAEELDALGDAILAALTRAPLDTTALRTALPKGSVRNLGEAGKKAGVTSPLPAALRRLEFAGLIGRVPIGDRLDTERYLWGRLPEPLAAFSGDPVRALAERVLRWGSPVRVSDLATWSGFGKREVEAAIAGIDGQSERAIDGESEHAISLAVDVTDAPLDDPSDGYSLLPFEDALYALHGGARWLVPTEFRDRPVARWGMGGKAPLGETAHLGQRALVQGGAIVGLWDYDPDAREVVARTFSSQPTDPDGLRRAVAATGAFLRDQVGHGRSFALDTDDALRARTADLRGPS